MKAAVVTGAGRAPIFRDFPEPNAGPGECRVAVAASALSHLARGRATGRHYSAGSAFPFVPGVDGVGRLDDGRRVAFLLPRAPHGGMAEATVVPEARCLPVPDALGDVAAAALINPGLSCFAALGERAKLQPGEIVLVNGATGVAGRLAVRVARHLGAARVIATGRNADALAAVGADATILLDEHAGEQMHAAFAQGVDVVVDYLWGSSAGCLLTAAGLAVPDERALRFVQVGNVSGPELALPAAVLRAKPITLLGSGLGSVPFDRLSACVGAALNMAATGGLFVEAARAVPLADIEAVWDEPDGDRRIVFVTVGTGDGPDVGRRGRNPLGGRRPSGRAIAPDRLVGQGGGPLDRGIAPPPLCPSPSPSPLP